MSNSGYIQEIEIDGNLKIAKKEEEKCPNNWYGGVGVNTNGYTITDVYKGYGADIAGMKRGDFILSIDDRDLLGEPGTKVSVIINRNGKILRLHITRSKVCY